MGSLDRENNAPPALLSKDSPAFFTAGTGGVSSQFVKEALLAENHL